MNIAIKTIPHNKQRYSTCGDYWYDKSGDLQIRISAMKNPAYEWLVLIHEMVEIFLCIIKGVSFKDIDKFDIEFEEKRHIDDISEPGDDLRAPYRDQHCAATGFEKILCSIAGIPWKTYDGEVEKL